MDCGAERSAIEPSKSLLLIEPFYGGSHRVLIDLLENEFGGDLHSLPATKWHWRSRASGLHFSQTLPRYHDYRTLFCSSVLNLCELVALRPDLASLHKVYYFHENQLIYPVRKQQDRDFQYGYNQILSCLVADAVIFNSYFNLHSFLEGIHCHFRLLPDFRPKGLVEQIKPKCHVLYFPVEVPVVLPCSSGNPGKAMSTESCKQQVRFKNTKIDDGNPQDFVNQSPADSNLHVLPTTPLHIVWPHRWEHDKGPEEFCSILFKLLDAGLPFSVSVLGTHTNDIPTCFQEITSQLGCRLLHYGHLPREEYWHVLQSADVVVSTAKHEFFGVAMLEAVACGCYPLCPNRLVYPEIYPSECLYNTEQQLFKRLKTYCEKPWIVRSTELKLKVSQENFSWSKLKTNFWQILKLDTLNTT